MYGHPGQQQSPNQPVHPQQGQQPYRRLEEQQPYAVPPAQQQQQQLPQHQNPNRPEMATMHPQFQGYHDPMPRLPAPGHMPPQGPQYYQQQPQPYQQQPPQQQQQQLANAAQSAPRQRTAIACKYCRRRKIRCSGFENAADGRCTNCVRFSQECVFTPVSAQTQAFVPAQAVYGRRGPQQGQSVQLYGPYGQPLPRGPDGYPPQYALPSPGHPPPPGQQPYYGPGYPPQQYPPPGYPPQQYEQQQHPPSQQPPPPTAAGSRRRRESDEPHTPTLPPPNPGHTSHLAGHEQQQPYIYSDQTGYAPSPSTAQQPYSNAPPASGYYPAQSQRTSPGGSAYSYEQPRGSHSPHTQAPYYGHSAGQPHAQGAASQAGRTPPPPQDGRNGLAIRDIVSDTNQPQGERTAADSDMVSALNRTSRR